jgi:hypothetical protein
LAGFSAPLYRRTPFQGQIVAIELDRIIYEKIYAETESIADFCHCFTEGDITSLDDPRKELLTTAVNRALMALT